MIKLIKDWPNSLSKKFCKTNDFLNWLTFQILLYYKTFYFDNYEMRYENKAVFKKVWNSFSGQRGFLNSATYIKGRYFECQSRWSWWSLQKYLLELLLIYVMGPWSPMRSEFRESGCSNVGRLKFIWRKRSDHFTIYGLK